MTILGGGDASIGIPANDGFAGTIIAVELEKKGGGVILGGGGGP